MTSTRETYDGYELITPMPVGWCSAMWSWLEETNFFEELIVDRQQLQGLLESVAAGQSPTLAWGVEVEGQPFAVVLYQCARPDSWRVGEISIVCPSDTWRTEVLKNAVCVILGKLMAAGGDKFSLPMFADDEMAYTFWRRLGAREEGLLRRHAIRDGAPADARFMALFRPESFGKKPSDDKARSASVAVGPDATTVH